MTMLLLCPFLCAFQTLFLIFQKCLFTYDFFLSHHIYAEMKFIHSLAVRCKVHVCLQLEGTSIRYKNLPRLIWHKKRFFNIKRCTEVSHYIYFICAHNAYLITCSSHNWQFFIYFTFPLLSHQPQLSYLSHHIYEHGMAWWHSVCTHTYF